MHSQDHMGSCRMCYLSVHQDEEEGPTRYRGSARGQRPRENFHQLQQRQHAQIFASSGRNPFALEICFGVPEEARAPNWDLASLRSSMDQ